MAIDHPCVLSGDKFEAGLGFIGLIGFIGFRVYNIGFRVSGVLSYTP